MQKYCPVFEHEIVKANQLFCVNKTPFVVLIINVHVCHFKLVRKHAKSEKIKYDNTHNK